MVAGVDDQGIIRHARRLQRLQNPADGKVDARRAFGISLHPGRKPAILFFRIGKSATVDQCSLNALRHLAITHWRLDRPFDGLLQLRRIFIGNMRGLQSYHQKKRLLLTGPLPDGIGGKVRDVVVGKPFLLHLLAIDPERLIEKPADKREAGPEIETLFRLRLAPQMKLADVARAIAGLLQIGREHRLVFQKRIIVQKDAETRSPLRILSSHYRGPRRRTDPVADKRVFKRAPLGRQLIKVRGFHIGASLVPHQIVTMIIRDDDHHVGTGLIRHSNQRQQES